MVVFPALATLISLACAAVIARDGLRRPAPHKTAWAVAFALFAAAAGAEAVAVASGWTPALVRVFYLAGAVLNVGFLGLGELYLLARRRVERIGPGIALLVTAAGASLVWAAPIDEARLAADGWEAMGRGPALRGLVALTSGAGTVVLVGGALWSAWRFRRLGVERHRMVGCLLIALGTLTVGAKGTLGRLDLPEASFNAAMALGVGIIFAGYLQTRRPDPRPAAEDGAGTEVEPVGAATPPERGGLVSLPPVALGGRRGGGAPAGDPGIAFLEERFLPLDDAALEAACRRWSAPRPAAEAFTREEARRVWALRLRLSPGGRERLDGHGVPAALQLADLYFGVLAPEAPGPAPDGAADGRYAAPVAVGGG